MNKEPDWAEKAVEEIMQAIFPLSSDRTELLDDPKVFRTRAVEIIKRHAAQDETELQMVEHSVACIGDMLELVKLQKKKRLAEVDVLSEEIAKRLKPEYETVYVDGVLKPENLRRVVKTVSDQLAFRREDSFARLCLRFARGCWRLLRRKVKSRAQA